MQCSITTVSLPLKQHSTVLRGLSVLKQQTTFVFYFLSLALSFTLCTCIQSHKCYGCQSFKHCYPLRKNKETEFLFQVCCQSSVCSFWPISSFFSLMNEFLLTLLVKEVSWQYTFSIFVWEWLYFSLRFEGQFQQACLSLSISPCLRTVILTGVAPSLNPAHVALTNENWLDYCVSLSWGQPDSHNTQAGQV